MIVLSCSLIAPRISPLWRYYAKTCQEFVFSPSCSVLR